MRKFLASLMLLVLMAPFALRGQNVDFTQQYRIKSISTNKYINVFNNTMHNSGAFGGVGVDDYAESNAQIFTLEDAGSNQFYLLSADGYYVKCWEWNVDAYSTTDKTALQMVDAGNETFYIKNCDNYKYFKVEFVAEGGETFIYGDCTGSCQETWTLEVVENNEEGEGGEGNEGNEGNEGEGEEEQPELAEIVLGDGTESTSVAPFKNANNYTWVETIYAKEEINLAFTINSIAYNCATYNAGNGYTLTADEIKVYMGETEQANHPTSADWVAESDLTLVYTGTNILLGEEEWETLVLDTPFEYSGTKNLVIAVSKSSSSTNSAMKWNYTSVDKANCYRSNNTNAAYAQYPANANGTTNGNRPNVKIAYSNASEGGEEGGDVVDPVVAEGDTWENAIEVTSFPFTSTPDFANLNNDYSLPGLGEDGKDVVYKLSLTEETTINATIEGANGKIALYAEDFNGEDGPNTGNYYVPTEEPEVPETNSTFFYDFNDGSMEGWRTIDQNQDTYTWGVSDGIIQAGSDGTKCLYSISTSLQPNDYVVTTSKYAINANSTLTFESKADNKYYPDYYSVEISEDGEWFLTIWEEYAPEAYTNNTVDLSNYAGKELYIAFHHYNSNYCGGVLIDNVKLSNGNEGGDDNEGNEGNEGGEQLATSFSFDFNDGSLSAFTTIDADGDGNNWNCYAYGIEGTSLASESFIIGVGVLNPDNYIYTTEQYTITAESELTFDLTWQYGEYYSVIVSTDGTTFTNVYEEQLTGSGQGYSDSKTIDLSAYAGQNIHIGLRHYNCSDGLRLMFDNLTLTAGNEGGEGNEGGDDNEGGEQLATSFLFDFNDQSLENFTIVDNDGDGQNWQIMEYGLNGSSIQSYSYDMVTYYPLTPDNYIITKDAYSITATSQLTYKVNAAWEEYYGIGVSEDGQNFTMVFEEAYQGTAKEVTVDLGAYAGKNVYVAVRHFNCSNGYFLIIDDLALSAGAKRSNSKTIEMTVPAGTYYLAASSTEAFTVNINIVNNNEEDDEEETGLPAVAQVVATENGANVDVAWGWENRNKLAIKDAKTGETKYINRDSEQGYNFHSFKLYRTDGENTIVLADNLTEATYQDATWSEATPGTYKWGVAAMYTAEEGRSRETVEVLNEGFETGYYVLPEGWTNYSEPATANEWGNIQVQSQIYTYMACTGEYSAFQLGGYADNGSLYYLVTPAVDFSSTLNPTISFKYISPAWAGAFNNAYVMYGESATGPWTTVWEGAAADAWTEASASLSECAGKTVYVAFCVLENKAWGAGIDNVVISGEAADGPIPVASEIVWSNSIDKDMTTTVSVAVTADDNASVAGTTVSLVNVNEPTFVYETTLDATGTYEWTEFRKGTYELTIALDGYYSCATAEVMEIMDATTINCTLEKMPELISGLYVSPTAWAMWEISGSANFDILLDGTTIEQNYEDINYQFNVASLVEGQEYKTTVIPNDGGNTVMEYTWTYRACDNFTGVTDLAATAENGNAVITWTLPVYENLDPVYEFSSDFDNGSLYGWRTIDGDGDGNNWRNTAEFVNQGFGVNNTYCAASLSYDNEDGALWPNNYLVTEIKYSITADSKLTYNISSHDRTYDEEHYAVAVSTTGNSASDFSIIFEETLSAGEAAYEGSTQGEWFSKEIDLSAYAGQDIYIAFRHYNCTNMAWIKLDNVSLTSTAKRDENGEWLFYDSGVNESAFGFFDYGTGEPQQINWAIMFPGDLITAYNGKQLTKVSIYVYEAHEGAFSIHKGGEYGPGTLVHVQTYNATATGTYQEFELTTPITIDASENLWIQFSNSNGGYVAAHSVDCGDPNGRWISDDGGASWYDSSWYGEGWYGTWQMRAYVEGEGSGNDNNGTANAEVLGTMIYRDGQYITTTPASTETYVDTEVTDGDHEYAVRVVYGGASDVTYYAMSCPQEVNVTIGGECAAPERLFGQYKYNEDGTFGAELIWPYAQATSEWLYYDNGVNQDGIGGPAEFYWGVMFPASSLNPYDGTFLTTVSLFDFAQSEGDINIYYGGTSAPGTLVHTQPYVGNGTGDFFEFELTSALPIDVTENLWVVFSTKNGTNYPASCCADCGDPNSRWISLDGATWEDVTAYGLYNTWMIRAMVSNEVKGEVSTLTAIDYEYTTGEGTFSAMGASRGETFEHYNIYRGTSANNFELVGESTEGTYFDEVEAGTYYYQVTAVYTNNGEECESEPATAYDNEEQNYVIVNVTAIDENGVNGMMVYPNPAKDNLNITAEGMINITITNALGQVMYENEVVSDNQIINMAQYEAGVYMVRITTENGVAVKQVTVVK